MADLQTDAVDDLKRRARRRLVGAVVLALAAAIILPMFLESDPKPLGRDVQIEIPPVDNNPFVSRPKEATPPPPAPAESPSATASAAPAPTEASKTSPIEPSAKTADKPIAKTETSVPVEPKAAPKAKETKPTEPGPNKSADAKPISAKAATNGESFVVQLAAFAEPTTAQALERKLKSGGFPAYTETLKTSHGALTRVRVGPFPSREAADGARAKLKDVGQNGMVTPLQ